MSGISIFCKSYRDDLERAVALVASVKKYNREALPFYISVPQNDLELFQNRLGMDDVQLLTDEAIIAANPAISLASYKSLPGHISQQIVKSEFWRINPQENYVCVDSDSRFIRNFYLHDFLSKNGFAYTVMHEDKSYSHFCLTHNLERSNEDFIKLKTSFMQYFGREGVDYNFGPFPVIWNAKVWRDLESNLLSKKGINIIDAICQLPSEGFWYGEALLKFQSIPALPRAPLFKAYLYFEEYEDDMRVGSNEDVLAKNYLGVVYQSNWYPKRLRLLNKFAYKLKISLRKISRKSK
jgi:hypothetical protein